MSKFGNFGERNSEISALDDTRLMHIDTTAENFYDNVLGYRSRNKKIKGFIKSVKEVKEACISPFWIPVFDPALEGEKIIFGKVKASREGHSFRWWKEKTAELPPVEGKKWVIGTDRHYYAFLTSLVNRLVEKGLCIEKAIGFIFSKPKEFNQNLDGACDKFRIAFNQAICGYYNLLNSYKMLACAKKTGNSFWIAGGNDHLDDGTIPLVDLVDGVDVELEEKGSVGWLVLQ